MGKIESTSIMENLDEVSGPIAIGLDVGASKIEAVLITNSGNVISRLTSKTQPDRGAEYVLTKIATLIDTLRSTLNQKSQIKSVPILGIGIGIPGQIDPASGIVFDAVNLGWDEVNIVKGVLSRLDTELPIWVETDTNASTVGEFHFGAAKGVRDFVYISIGSGLGGGLFINGVLHTGVNGKSAELGHLSLNPNGEKCVCGLHGCAETIVSGPGLIKLFAENQVDKKYNINQKTISEFDSRSIIEAAKTGDKNSLIALSKMGQNLGIIISNCASILDPELIVIGGGLGLAAFDLIIDSTRLEIERRVLPSIHSNLKIIPTQQVSSALGAASLVFFHPQQAIET